MESFKFCENRSLSAICTMGVGGLAKKVIVVNTISAMQEAIAWCKRYTMSFLVIGKGSNCLFSDAGFDGAILLNKIDFFENPSPDVYRVGAGFSFSHLGTLTAKKGLSGLEFAAGIPATVGGAVFMNAGANGQETSAPLESVEYIDRDGNFHVVDKSHLEFSYRHSSFHSMKGCAIVAATFRLTRDAEARKKQLSILRFRMSSQPYSEKSAGCIFQNTPVGPAGLLIEQSGLKGFSIGGAMVSTLHANFIVNHSHATQQEISALINEVQSSVKKCLGIVLEREVRMIP